MSFTNEDGFQISYDYEDLIMDLEQDVKDGNFKMSDIIVVERSAKDRMGYKPILDYFVDEDTADLAMMGGIAKPDSDYRYMTVRYILDEMKKSMKQYDDTESHFNFRLRWLLLCYNEIAISFMGGGCAIQSEVILWK